MSQNGFSTWKVDAVGLGVCVMLTALVLVIGVSPRIDQVREADERQHDLRGARVDASDKERSVRDLRTQFNSLQKQANQLAVNLQPAKALNERLGRIALLAQNLGIRVNQLQPGTTSKGNLFDTVRITLSGVGGFADCARFVHELGERHPDMAVHTFELSPSSDIDAGSSAFRLDIVWFAAAD